MNSDCIHCNIYFLSRENLVKRKKKLFEKKIMDMYPINYKCTNIYCNTIKELNSYVKDETIIDKERKLNMLNENKMEIDNLESNIINSDNESFTNWDNWDIEPHVKVFRKKKKKENISELQGLFKNISICNKNNQMKKRRKLKQLKITDFDINNLFNNLNI
jgi:hypothetical protein|tara:strand:+ start:680 stop:1162 length:483 start_codon:yes stop_codon:yes gene_type:complete